MLQMFHLDVTKVDLVLHMLQRDPSAVVHARAKRRDGKRRGWRQGHGRSPPLRAAGHRLSPLLRVEPDNFYRLSENCVRTPLGAGRLGASISHFEFLSLNKSRAEIHGGGFKVWVEFMKRFKIAGGGHCSEL